jgi:hypothetical protein
MSTKAKIIGVVAILAAGAFLVVGWSFRTMVMRFAPVHHTGEVARIGTFHKGGIARKHAGTHQLNQFAILFVDGFQCEGSDTSFAAIKAGDIVEIRGYHDVKGYPVLDPEWWECDEAQLVRLAQ